MTKAALYIRVSTQEQAQEGFSINAQRKNLSKYCEAMEIDIFDLYVDDGYSAKDTDRPELQRLLTDANDKKFDAVLVDRLDRFSRSVRDMYDLVDRLQKTGVSFQSRQEKFDTGTPMGRAVMGVLSVLSQWERETIAARVRTGMEQMVIEGKRPGGLVPYGYDSELLQIPDEVELIRLVRSLYMDGVGYKAIALRLNREGKLRRGKEWSSATVAYTLENPFYAAIIRLGSKTSDGVYVNHRRDERVNCLYGEGWWEPIFTQDEYEEHKAFMERKSQNGFSNILTYWFSGVLRCGRCGSSMFGKLSNKRSLKTGETIRTPYYICAKKHDGRSCDMPIFRQVHIEHLLFDYIKKAQLQFESLQKEVASTIQDTGKSVDEVTDLKRELAKISERKKKWQYMFVEGLISSEDVKARIKEENEIESQLQKDIANMQKMSSGVPRIQELQQLAELWASIDDDDKKEAVYTLFERITVNTNLTNVKGVKNKYFDAYLEEVLYV